jgi:solute:Na+ symporter, SSS family
MIPAIVVFIYLGIVLYVGLFAFRKSTGSKEDFFLASRSLGPWVFLLTVFGTNMTAFAILGSSGLAYQRGIGVYGLMASSSGLIIPLTIFLIGTRLWALGKKHGYITQVQYFRDRWQCDFIGTVIFAVTALMMIPYVVIGMMGGGHTLEGLSGGAVPYWRMCSLAA